jgi:hypothetical protein
VQGDSIFNTFCDLWSVYFIPIVTGQRQTDSSAKFVCALQPVVHQLLWNAEL